MMCRPNALQTSGHMPGEPQQHDRSSDLPSRLRVRPPTAAASGCRSANLASFSMARSKTTVSGLSSSTQRPVLCWKARLFARPNPRFAPGSTSFTQGNSRRTISAEPSLERLSTTIVSYRTSPACSFNDLRQSRSSSLTFQLTMQTLTSGAPVARATCPCDFSSDRSCSTTNVIIQL
jgi:hypothetical protein